VVFDQESRQKVAPGNGAPQEAAILEVLEKAQPRGPTAIGKALGWLQSRLRRRGIVAIFSDFFDDVDAIVEGLRRLVFAGHEPILFRILDPQEMRFEFDGFLKLDGLEGTGVHKVDPKAIRAAYLAEIEAHDQSLARQARALSVDYVQLLTSQPLDAALSTYLARRGTRARGGRY
jgi:uncharacterized protein (DUF58 family)